MSLSCPGHKGVYARLSRLCPAMTKKARLSGTEDSYFFPAFT